jgi:hypothetical protein
MGEVRMERRGKDVVVVFRDRRRDWTSLDLLLAWRTTRQISCTEYATVFLHPRLRGPYSKSFLDVHVSFRAAGLTRKLY